MILFLNLEEQSAEERGIEIEADRSKAEEERQVTEQEKEVKQPKKNKAESKRKEGEFSIERYGGQTNPTSFKGGMDLSSILKPKKLYVC